MSAAHKARIVDEAMSWLATPYRHQASVKHHGTDCLGLIRGVYRALYGEEPEALPPYPSSPKAWGGGEPLLEAAQRNLVATGKPQQGVAVFFRLHRSAPISHCGIMASTEGFIHSYQGRGVIVSTFGAYWQRHLAAVFDFPESP